MMAHIPRTNVLKKNTKLIQEVITKYHPIWSIPSYRDVAMSQAEEMNVETMVEVAIAFYLRQERRDEVGYDIWPSLIEVKTTSVVEKSRKLEITNVQTKVGDVMVVIYNPLVDEVHYMRIPKDEVHSIAKPGSGGKKGTTVISFSYSTVGRMYGLGNKYLVSSFEEMCDNC